MRQERHGKLTALWQRYWTAAQAAWQEAELAHYYHLIELLLRKYDYSNEILKNESTVAEAGHSPDWDADMRVEKKMVIC